jgi:hypothetical protein
MHQFWSQEEDRILVQMMGYTGGTKIPFLPGAVRDYESWTHIALGLQSYYLSTGRYTPRHYKADIVSAHWTNEIRPMLVVEHTRVYCGGVSNLAESPRRAFRCVE